MGAESKLYSNKKSFPKEVANYSSFGPVHATLEFLLDQPNLHWIEEKTYYEYDKVQQGAIPPRKWSWDISTTLSYNAI